MGLKTILSVDFSIEWVKSISSICLLGISIVEMASYPTKYTFLLPQ